MKKYYFNDGTAQQGPFTLEELQAKNITAETPVWYDGLPDWTTAGQVEELKDILVHTPPPFHTITPSAAEQVKPSTPVTPVTVTETAAPAATVTAAAAPAKPAKSAKKSTAWLSYVLFLLVLGAVGYFVYQDMEKNKENKNISTVMTPATDSAANTTMQQPATEQSTSTVPSADDTAKTETTTTATTEPATTTPATTTTTTVIPTTTQPATVTTTKTTAQPVATKPTAAEIKAKQIEAQKLAQKKAEEEKKKLQAAQAAAAAKEKEYRNNWPRYITFGKLDYNTNGDGIDAFNVPVFNSTNAMLDKVTIRVDYMKKDKKVVKSETIFIYNIPPASGLNGKAPESKKGNNIKLFITGITSRKLHFCYPSNNGNPTDPYLCN